MSLDLSSYKPVVDGSGDANQIANGFQAIQTEVNDLPIANLHGYPSDATKFLRGDGSWAVPPQSTTYRKTTAKTVANSVAETDLLNGDITIGAAALGTSGMLRLTASGDWLQNSGAPAAYPRFRVKLGSGPTTVFDIGASVYNVDAGATRYPWRVEIEVANLGAANSQWVTVTLELAGHTSNFGGAYSIGAALATGEGYFLAVAGAASSSAPVKGEGLGVNTAAIDTTLAMPVQLTVVNGVASATYETTLKRALAEIL